MAVEESASFGALLRRHRERAGLTQQALAERSGMSLRGVSDLERGARRAPYSDTARRLADALGLVEPHRTALAAAGRRTMATRAAPPMPAGLPASVNSFVGREQELVDVRSLLASARLLTLTGAGGVGKTRLAIEAVRTVWTEFADGVWLVELAPLADSRLVPQAVAAVLGVREQPGQALLTTLADVLRSQSLLIVLDNCEHVLQACAELVASLLRASADAPVLATSREALGIAGETTFEVPPLSLPHTQQPALAEHVAESDAVRLFTDRASAASRGFALTDHNASALAQICRRLDGMPLAIELAAARVRVLSPREIAARLDDRFRFLVAGTRTGPPRQQTLAATVSWSYELLPDDERRLFERLSVFAGGFDLDAAEAVCSDVDQARRATPTGAEVMSPVILELLARLVDQSLVVVDADDAAGPTRYRLLETLGAYASQQLVAHGGSERVSGRHARYYGALAEELSLNRLEVHGDDERDRMACFEREHENMRAALAWLTQERLLEQALNLSGALAWFWEARGYVGEGRDRLAKLLGMAGEHGPGARLEALLGAAGLAWAQGDYAAQERLSAQGVTIARALDEPMALASSLLLLGQAANSRGDYATARTLLEECIEISRRDPRLQPGGPESLLGNSARDQGDFATARSSYEAALSHKTTPSERGHFLSNMGWLAYYEGNLEEARVLQAASLQLRRQLNEPRGIAVSLTVLGKIAFARGDQPAARALYTESLPLHRAVGNQWGVALVLEGLADLVATDQPSRALQLAGAAAGVRNAIGRPMPPAERPIQDRNLMLARRALSPAAQAEAWAAGLAMSLEESAAVELGRDVPRDAVVGNTPATPATSVEGPDSGEHFSGSELAPEPARAPH